MASKEQNQPSHYIEQLTWLRGLAAFLVILCHATRASEVDYDPDAFNLGSFAVALFFAVSGCALYISNADKVTGARNIIAFYIKRFFRIWPAYIVSLAAYMIFIPIFKDYYGVPHNHWIERQFWVDYSLSDVLKYATLVFDFTGPVNFFNGAYWSMPIEFQYYLLFPLLLLSLRYMGTMGPLTVGFFVFFVPFFRYFGDNVKVDVFGMLFIFGGGIVLGYMTTKDFKKIPMIYGLALLAASLAIVTVIQMHIIRLIHIPMLYNDPWVIYGIGAILSVFSLLVSKVDFPARMKALLKGYGEISYSTYLFHNLFIGSAVLIEKQMEFYDSDMRYWFILGFTLVCSTITAALSYRFIEKPFIAYGHKFSRSFLNRKLASA